MQWDSAYGSKFIEGGDVAIQNVPLVGLCATHNTIRITASGVKTIGLETVDVKPAPPPEPLRLAGSVLQDPNRLVRIHTRFPSELVSLGTVLVDQTLGGHLPAEQRPLRFGDVVTKDQILAQVWSKDIGEKKSELVAAVSQTAIDLTLLTRLEKVEKGVVPEPRLQEARRNYEASRIAAARAERTLRAWRLTDDEIKEVRHEAMRIHNRQLNDPQVDRTWAETEVRSPINGIIVEKNFNVGDIIDPSQDLFKIVDLDRVQVLANAFEEDLPLLRSLRPEQRKWRIFSDADPNVAPIAGTFDIIGSIIDPAQHAGAVMGSLDNTEGRLSIGEFITALIDLPADPTWVAVPTSALIEDGGCTKVFVVVNAEQHEFECRKIDVARRGRDLVYVRSVPQAASTSSGAEPLKDGEQVVRSGVLELAAEMKSLQAVAREH